MKLFFETICNRNSRNKPNFRIYIFNILVKLQYDFVNKPKYLTICKYDR